MGKCKSRHSSSFHSKKIVLLNLYELFSKAKLFADDTYRFNVALDTNTSANELNSDLKKVSN